MTTYFKYFPLNTYRILDQRNCHNSVVFTILIRGNKDEGHIIESHLTHAIWDLFFLQMRVKNNQQTGTWAESNAYCRAGNICALKNLRIWGTGNCCAGKYCESLVRGSRNPPNSANWRNFLAAKFSRSTVYASSYDILRYCYLTRAVNSPASDLGKGVLGAVSRVPCLVSLSCPDLFRESNGRHHHHQLVHMTLPGRSFSKGMVHSNLIHSNLDI